MPLYIIYYTIEKLGKWEKWGLMCKNAAEAKRKIPLFAIYRKKPFIISVL